MCQVNVGKNMDCTKNSKNGNIEINLVTGIENIENKVFNMFNTPAATTENFRFYCFKNKELDFYCAQITQPFVIRRCGGCCLMITIIPFSN